MPARLDGRVAVVTGASSGNGRAISLALAAEGASVVCADMRREPLAGGYDADAAQPTDELIRSRGGKSEFVETDVTSGAAMEALVASAVTSFGRVDVFVNNAGIGWIRPITEETEEEYDKLMAVNAKGVFLGCKYAVAQMLTQEPVGGSRGRIVNISSIGGLVGLASEPAYCMSKGAVVLLTKTLGIDYAKERINVNAVCPGFIETAMTRPYLEDTDFNAAIHAVTPWPEIGQAEDVAEAVLFFAADSGRWATGTSLAIDGGFTAP